MKLSYKLLYKLCTTVTPQLKEHKSHVNILHVRQYPLYKAVGNLQLVPCVVVDWYVHAVYRCMCRHILYSAAQW